MDPLDALRRRIDALDDRILGLLNERARVVLRVYTLKQRRAGDGPARVYVPRRQRDILRRLSRSNPGPFPTAWVAPVFHEIVSASLSLEGSFKVAYAGSRGSAAHRAALGCFGRAASLIPAADASGVLRRLERGSAAYGVVPLASAKAGRGARFAPCARWKDPVDPRARAFAVLGPAPRSAP